MANLFFLSSKDIDDLYNGIKYLDVYGTEIHHENVQDHNRISSVKLVGFGHQCLDQVHIDLDLVGISLEHDQRKRMTAKFCGRVLVVEVSLVRESLDELFDVDYVSGMFDIAKVQKSHTMYRLYGLYHERLKRKRAREEKDTSDKMDSQIQILLESIKPT